MANNQDKFGGIFKVKEDDVFSELDEVKTEPTKKGTEKKSVSTKTEKPVKPADEKLRLEKYSLYLTPEQHKALKIRAVQSDNPKEKDISAIVRAAIDSYLKN